MNDDLSRVLLGSLLMKPALLESCDISSNDFSPGRLRETFVAITELWENDRPPEIDAIILSARLGDGAASFVSELMSGMVRPSPEVFAGRLAELRHRQISTQIVQVSGQLAEDHLKCGDFDATRFQELRSLLAKQDALELAGKGEQAIANALKKGSELQTMEINVQWILDKLLPQRSVTLFHGPGGIGKTWLGLLIAKAVSTGTDLFSLKVKSGPVVYVDFENPLPVLIDRVRKLDIRDVLFWHLSAETRPPKLDSDDYRLYKQLSPGSLLIFDTLRSAQDGDENNSRDMALVMGRCKEIREAGFSILLGHHSPKSNERQYKGSTAISDLADHVLAIHKVRPSTFEEIEDDVDPDPNAMYYFGSGKKTRYERHYVYLQFTEQASFVLAEDPDLEALASLADLIRNFGHPATQSEIVKLAKADLEFTRKKTLKLLKKGDQGNRWNITKDIARNNRILYEVN